MKRSITRVSALLAIVGLIILFGPPAALATPVGGTAASQPWVPFPKVPGAPTHTVATAGNAVATVRWTAPKASGGSAILSYVAFSTPGSKTCSAPPGSRRTCTVRGLTNFVSYTFQVIAINAEGKVQPRSPRTPSGQWPRWHRNWSVCGSARPSLPSPSHVAPATASGSSPQRAKSS